MVNLGGVGQPAALEQPASQLCAVMRAVHVVEILAVLPSVAAEAPHASVEKDYLRARSSSRGRSGALQVGPATRIEIQRVDVTLPRGPIRASEEIERALRIHHRVPRSRAVHVAGLREELPLADFGTRRSGHGGIESWPHPH